MASPDWREEIPTAIRTLQIIVLAMLVGSIFFLAFVLFVPFMLDVAVAGPISIDAWFVAGCVMICQIFFAIRGGAGDRRSILRALEEISVSRDVDIRSKCFADREDQIGKELIALFRRRTIVTVAMSEGAAFVVMIAYLVERSAVSLAIAVVLMALLVIQVPMLMRASRWIEAQMQSIKETFEMGV